jgi:chorismate dehydratase
MQNYNISAVSYLNTKPFIFGIEQSSLMKQIRLFQDFPALCAQKLLKDEVDIALVPVAVIPYLTSPHIVADYCIGADGPVKTVCLFSQVPLEEIKTIYLDYQSRTSVQLLQILCRDYWNISPKMVDAYPGYTSEISGDAAGVIIGDRAVAFLHYPYVYDLAEIWKDYTGLPFVFAAWVANKPIDEDFIQLFNLALDKGLLKRHEIAARYKDVFDNSYFSTDYYLMHNISYTFDTPKKEAMLLFLKKYTENAGIPLPEVHFSECATS